MMPQKSPAQENSAYSFFVAGHTYGAPGIDNVGFHPPFKAAFDYIRNYDEMQFGVLVGDIVSSDPTIEDWEEIDKDLKQLGLPVYLAAGNHDVEDRQLFENRYGPTYYSFTFQNDLFVILDPNLDSWNISGYQLDFLRNVISEKHLHVENIFVFFHQILWREDHNQFGSVSWNSAAGRSGTTNFWSEVMPIFQTLTNEVVMFAGDLGARWASDVMYHRCRNITLVATGMGDGKGDNIIIANVASNKKVDYDLICLNNREVACLGELSDHEIGSCEDHSISDILTVYPNPVTDWLTIRKQGGGFSELELLDFSGRLVMRSQWDSYRHSINLSAVKNGLYVTRVSSEGQVYHQKISKVSSTQ